MREVNGKRENRINVDQPDGLCPYKTFLVATCLLYWIVSYNRSIGA